MILFQLFRRYLCVLVWGGLSVLISSQVVAKEGIEAATPKPTPAQQREAQRQEALMSAQKPEKGEVQRRVRTLIAPESTLSVYDPWEPMNRAIYNFNSGFDHYVFLPVVKGYDTVTPEVVQSGVSNFFSNLMEVRNLFNNMLQFRVKDSGITLGRFVINTTVGVAGLWDPASKIGMHEKREDFGQTLGVWGVGSGPYLVVPFLGPSSLRDTGGFGVDYAVRYNVDLLDTKNDANKDGIRIAADLLMAIDTRKNVAFRYHETGSPFEYELVRYAYGEMRKIEIEK
jgi:phospholipid-binding lipoprotein MlaA